MTSIRQASSTTQRRRVAECRRIKSKSSSKDAMSAVIRRWSNNITAYVRSNTEIFVVECVRIADLAALEVGSLHLGAMSVSVPECQTECLQRRERGTQQLRCRHRKALVVLVSLTRADTGGCTCSSWFAGLVGAFGSAGQCRNTNTEILEISIANIKKQYANKWRTAGMDCAVVTQNGYRSIFVTKMSNIPVSK